MSKKPKHDQTANVVKPDGSNEVVRPQGDTWTLEELQALVEGYIEVKYLPDDQIAIFNEEGRIKGMAPNPLASTMACVSLVGPVVFGHRSILR